MKKLLALLSVLVLCTLLFAVGLATESRTFIDTMGNEVTINEVPSIVVSLTPSNTEILYALGVGDKVKGVDQYSNYPAQALENAEVVGDFNGPNVESILALNPDVVFAGNFLQQEAIDQLKETGIPVVCVEATSILDVFPSIQLVADIMKVDSSKILAKMEADTKEAETYAEKCEGKSVYCAISFGDWGDWTAGEGSFISEMINHLGATNIADDLGIAWPQYSIEQLLEKNPDVILISGDQSMVESFIENPVYADLDAVANGNVFPINSDTISRPSPRLSTAHIDIAKAIASAK